MEWQALQAIAELVAAAGVIASLLYVAGQVRQNTRSVQAATSQDLISSLSEVTSFAAQSPFGARLYHAALLGEWSQLTAEEQSAARMFYLRSMRLFDHAYLQYRFGLLDEQAWLGWSHQIRVVAGLRGWQDVWPSFRPWLSPSFVEWVEALRAQQTRQRAGITVACTRLARLRRH